MNFYIVRTRELFEAAYKEAIRASDMGNYALAQKRFVEAAQLLQKLSGMDPVNRDVYNARAEKMFRISSALEAKVEAERQAMATDRRNVDTSAVAESSASFYEPKESAAPEDMSSFYTFFQAKDLTDGFDKVIGLDEAKNAVTEYVINPIRYPEAYNYNFMSSKCILLEGPPGTGKTTFAKAVAKEIEQPFALVNVAALVNCYVGETGKTIDKVFDSLRQYVQENGCGITVFFDEFDEIAKSRGGDDKASQTAVPALLRNLDGVKENKNFLIIANTNCVEMLDAGILSRFRRKIYIPLPDLAMRIRFFKDKLSQLEEEHYSMLNFELLAEAAEGMSGRTISQICDDFLHFIGGVKAGIRSCSDYNSVMLDYIRNAK